MASDYRQLNIRVRNEDFDVLAAAAWLDGESVAEFVRPRLEQWIQELRNDSEIAAAIRLQAERAARKEGKLSRIASRRLGSESS
ncbi:hypothetical protein [Baekduia sp.]|jgi:uncharacterized protein (DUF1778 family)|uniref:hypothetical protein n=1 Tax=Baekduia sp. TaxID=2600305 RepID=UPI002E0019F3|nr:hypothetical protein [Baekduia sp.]